MTLLSDKHKQKKFLKFLKLDEIPKMKEECYLLIYFCSLSRILA